VSDLPLFTDPKDAEAYANALGRNAGIAATSVLPAWMTQLSPYRVDPQGEGHWQFPGGLQAAYGAAGTLGPMLYNWGAGAAGLRGRLPPAPGAEQALNNYAETRDMAFRTIPHVQPQTPDEQMSQDLAFSTAGMATPGAGVYSGLAKALPFVGRPASAISKFAIPDATMANATIGGVMAG
jgi:hypothetical protein